MYFSTSFIALSISLLAFSIVLSPKDFKPVFGKWEGTITYKDYTSGKPFTMPARITVSQEKSERKALVLEYDYPNEPKANGNDTLVFSKDGKQLDGEMIVSKITRDPGVREIITEKEGKDGNDNKAALIRHIYIISKQKFIIRKEVKFVGEQQYIMRNEYSMSR